MHVRGVPETFTLAGLGYHDPVWSPDGTPEGAQTALPVYVTADDQPNSGVLIIALVLLYLMAKG